MKTEFSSSFDCIKYHATYLHKLGYYEADVLMSESSRNYSLTFLSLLFNSWCDYAKFEVKDNRYSNKSDLFNSMVRIRMFKEDNKKFVLKVVGLALNDMYVSGSNMPYKKLVESIIAEINSILTYLEGLGCNSDLRYECNFYINTLIEYVNKLV